MTNPKYAKTEKTGEDRKAVRQTVLDYIEAWYQGDPDRGAQSLHPDLAKRIVRFDKESGQETLDPMSAERLIERWGSGDGKTTPVDNQKKEITLLDLQGGMASVKLETAAWTDFMHLARINGRWVIVNILWERKK
ncbi:MAG: nuclear transport factor 2 family protein [Thermodesulfobacteriota bacterium]